ncbi:CAF17-like 4Fe-4S cluster assembly/insertion protein YgfZ [Afifella pfennigii]|uniref:CAF17-like 4Fe-4S cluster assembly/insertion protein YgfZ n=1 Tax=Afifella pfennigii TaxID=209897 RepID=UPI00047E7162|nr:folate-binding protein YgfZ [Afifella pfennigii]
MPLARLTKRTVLRVAGPDARHFLANLMTCEPPGEGGAAYGALLTPQGKIIADFILHDDGESFALDVRREVAADLSKRLTLYRLRSKVTIEDVGEALYVFAGWDEAAPEGAHADPRLAALGWRRLAAPEALSPSACESDYHAHRIALAIPEGGEDFLFGEAFPHDAAMDCLNGVAFKKGCYIGQEVVSRMQHRGTARRRIVALAALDAARELPEPGADITADGRPVGRLGSCANGKAVALARLDRLGEALKEGVAIMAGEAAVAAELPDWACYTWPATAAAGEG